MFPSQVTRYPYVSKDDHHKITYGTPSTLNCKYAKLSKTVTGNNGKAVLAVAWTSFPAGTIIDPDDKIVLPDGSFSEIVLNHEIHNHVGVDKCVDVYYGEGSI